MSPTLSLQLYAEPFVSGGAYNAYKELVDARNPDYGLRYTPYAYDIAANGNPDFNVKSFRTTNVLRWEYKPGSTLFVVWQQARENDAVPGRLPLRPRRPRHLRRRAEERVPRQAGLLAQLLTPRQPWPGSCTCEVMQSMSVRVAAGVVVVVAALSVATTAQRGIRQRLAPGQECPPGTTETRPGNCQAPEFPPPSITDYRPKSTLVTAGHPVPKSKFPTIDIHGHPPSLTSPASIEAVVSEMDKLNLRVLVSADNSSGDRLTRVLQAINASPHKDRFRVLAGINFKTSGPAGARMPLRSSRRT